MDSDHLHHLDAIGRYMGLNPKAVQHLWRKHDLPLYKIGRTVAASKASIDKWRAEQEAAARSVAAE